MTNTVVGISFIAVSSKPQTEEVSLDHQREINYQNAQRLGVVIPPENNLCVPGHTREYDTLAEIMEDVEAYRQLWEIIRNRQAHVLFAYTPSRLARTESLLMDLSRKCWRHGVALYIHTMPPQSLDPRVQKSDMSQKLLLAIGGVQSGDDMEKLRENHRTGMAHRVKVKKLDPGKLRFGYTYEYVGNERRKAIDPIAAEVVRFILLDLYVSQQDGQQAIINELNARRMITPSVRRSQLWQEEMPMASDVWHKGSVYEIIIGARHYAGYLEYNRRTTRSGYDTGREKIGWVKADFPAIFTEEEITLIEDERARRSVGPRRTYPLSGLCVCSECGKLMSGNLQRDRYWSQTGNQYRYMRCRSCRVFVREDAIIKVLSEVFDYIEKTADVTHLFRRSQDVQESDMQKQLVRFADEALTIEAAISRLVDALADGTLPTEQIMIRLKERQARLKEIETGSEILQRQLLDVRLKLSPQENADEIRTSGHQILDAMEEDPIIARQWLQRHIQQIIIYRNGECDVIFS